jgi:NAD(P)-dependent dehydrogenase (short-subunit alcohol dehydrogenase family)
LNNHASGRFAKTPVPARRQRALVTGGGRGIGLAAASALAAAGARVTLAARTTAEVEEAAAAIRARGDKADALTFDDECRGCEKDASGGRAVPDSVNNAGGNRPAYLRDVKSRTSTSSFAQRPRGFSWRRPWRCGC